jgi:hypothetical protein
MMSRSPLEEDFGAYNSLAAAILDPKYPYALSAVKKLFTFWKLRWGSIPAFYDRSQDTIDPWILRSIPGYDRSLDSTIDP